MKNNKIAKAPTVSEIGCFWKNNEGRPTASLQRSKSVCCAQCSQVFRIMRVKILFMLMLFLRKFSDKQIILFSDNFLKIGGSSCPVAPCYDTTGGVFDVHCLLNFWFTADIQRTKVTHHSLLKEISELSGSQETPQTNTTKVSFVCRLVTQ